MTKEKQKETFRWVLLIFGFLFVAFTLLLCVGGDILKSCCIVKILCSAMLVLALVGGLIGIWCCKTENSCPPFVASKKLRSCVPYYDNGVAIVRGTKESYTVNHFDSIKKAFESVIDGDTICIFDSEIKLSEKELNSLFIKQGKIKNLSIRFMDFRNITLIKS